MIGLNLNPNPNPNHEENLNPNPNHGDFWFAEIFGLQRFLILVYMKTIDITRIKVKFDSEEYRV